MMMVVPTIKNGPHPVGGISEYDQQLVVVGIVFEIPIRQMNCKPPIPYFPLARIG
jgi:hypothetical protein